MYSELRMFAESFYIPKIRPGKPALGEDAHFICNEAQVIGVADGVGSWSKQGIDAGKYARGLMKNAEEYVQKSHAAAAAAAIHPKSILTNAYNKTGERGSSTACILSLHGDLLRVANVGDSGCMVIRGGKRIFRTPVQQYKFNHPYQLGVESGCNSPNDAAEFVVRLEMGDVVVAGTDGLFDNMFLADVQKTVRRCLMDEMSPAVTAHELANDAKRNSLNRTVSPFELAALAAGKPNRGGKYDDITVVVAYVLDSGTRIQVEHKLEDVDRIDTPNYFRRLIESCGILAILRNS